MPVEKSAGAVIFKREGDGIHYLLLHYPASKKSAKNYWDFPKGHIEGKEKIEETAKREAEEETGLKDLKFVQGFRSWMKYFFRFEGKTVFKIVTYFLAETKTKEVKISFEHTGFEWLSFKEAQKQLTFKNAREILKKADEFLGKKSL
jgi:bis(5'-nucleosidyl)-tetraphosphatase